MSAVAWFAVVATVGLLAAVAGLARVRVLLGRRGAFECARLTSRRAVWGSGIAVFVPDRLEWYRLLSFSPRPAFSWSRAHLRVVERRPRLERGRRTSVVEVTCAYDSGTVTLAMREQVAAGFVSWLEAAPPAGWAWSDSVREE